MPLPFQKFLWLIAISGVLSACAAPEVQAPAFESAPAQFKEAQTTYSAASETSDTVPVPDTWWTLFNDSVLNDLERRVIIGNESLKASLAQIATVRATLDASYSAKFPTLSTGLQASRSGSPSSATQTVQNPLNTVALTTTAAWEVDVWGKLSKATQAAQANFQASQADLAAVRLSAQSLLVQTYFSMRAAESQMAVLERTVQAYQHSLELTQARLQSGVAALSDELQARTQLNTAKAQLADFTAQRAQYEHAIAVLIGVPPSKLSTGITGVLAEPLEIPALLPSTLLQRRPDIAAARQRVEAAYAQIGLTDAAMFPSVGLSASVAYSQNSLSNLLDAPNLLWSLGASLTQSILDGGVRTQASAQARAAADAATSNYRQLVLTSLQEVEDNLVLAEQLKSEVGWQQQALQAAQRSLQITQEQYRAGTASYLNVVIAQATALSAESNLIAVKNRQLAALNILLKNIAGRWAPVAPT